MDNIHALAAATRMSHHTHTRTLTHTIHTSIHMYMHTQRERERERGGGREGIDIISGDIKRHESSCRFGNGEQYFIPKAKSFEVL